MASSGSLLSSITSFFSGNAAGSNGPGSSSRSRQGAGQSAFSSGGGYGYAPRRTQGSGDDWTLPYTHYGGGPSRNTPGTPGSTGPQTSYPPRQAGPYGYNGNVTNASLAEFTNMQNPGASTSNLVPHRPGSGSASFGLGGSGSGGPSGSASRTSTFGLGLGLGLGSGSGAGGGASGTGSGASAAAISGNMPASAYPPLRHTWRRIQAWSEEQYPELWDTVNYPALEADIDELEMHLGLPLPPCVRESLLVHNGQELESYSNSTGGGSCTDGLFFGMPMLSVDQCLQEWTFWRSVDDDPETGASREVRGRMTSCPDGWIRTDYSNRGWLPLITDRVGNYIGVDLNPPSSTALEGGEVDGSSDDDYADSSIRASADGRLANGSTDDPDSTANTTLGDATNPIASGAALHGKRRRRAQSVKGPGGSYGQVIVFGRDFDTKVVLWRGEGEGGWGRFLQMFAEELESGEMWTLEEQSAGSEDEEDNIGYEGYFSGGGAAGGKGGGDHGGDGHAGFRLHGDYKGWPVLEAWADRSIRAWEELGFRVGVPANQHPDFYAYDDEQPPLDQQGVYYGEPPSLQIHPSGDPEDGVEEQPDVVEASLVDPLSDASTPTAVAAPAGQDDSFSGTTPTDGVAHPLQDTPVKQQLAAGEQAPSTPIPGVSRPSVDTLSPPAHTRMGRAAGKQREVDQSLAGAQPARRKPPAPAPVASLDLPTIADVRAAHAAALAEAGRSGSHQFALDLNVDPSSDQDQRGSSDHFTHSSGGFFGAHRRAINSSAGNHSLHDVVVDPASMSPRPSTSADPLRMPSPYRTSTGSPPLQPDTPGALALANGTETFQPLIDANSRPSSPAFIGSRPSVPPKANHSSLANTDYFNGSPQHSSVLVSTLPSTNVAPSAASVAQAFGSISLTDTEGRGSPKPLVRAAYGPSHSRSNSIKGAMSSVA